MAQNSTSHLIGGKPIKGYHAKFNNDDIIIPWYNIKVHNNTIFVGINGHNMQKVDLSTGDHIYDSTKHLGLLNISMCKSTNSIFTVSKSMFSGHSHTVVSVIDASTGKTDIVNIPEEYCIHELFDTVLQNTIVFTSFLKKVSDGISMGGHNNICMYNYVTHDMKVTPIDSYRLELNTVSPTSDIVVGTVNHTVYNNESSNYYPFQRWNVITGEKIGDPITVHTDFITNFSFSQNGAILLSADNDCNVYRFDAYSGVQIGNPIKHNNDIDNDNDVSKITQIKISNDGNTLMIAQGNKIYRWNTTTYKLISPTYYHKKCVCTMDITDDDSTIVSVCDDGKIYRWTN